MNAASLVTAAVVNDMEACGEVPQALQPPLTHLRTHVTETKDP